MTLSQELRQSVISRVEQGIQYRDISRELNISVGSIVNIIKNHKTGNGHEQPIEVKTLQAQNHVVYEPNQKQELQDIDFADNPYPESDVYTGPNADYDERYDGLEGERRFNYQTPMFPKHLIYRTLAIIIMSLRKQRKLKKIQKNHINPDLQHQILRIRA